MREKQTEESRQRARKAFLDWLEASETWATVNDLAKRRDSELGPKQARHLELMEIRVNEAADAFEEAQGELLGASADVNIRRLHR